MKEISRAVGASFLAKSAYAETNPQAWKRMIADLEQQLPRLLSESAVPGASLAIIKDAKLFWCRGFGITGNTSRQRVDPDTVFAAASMSKPVFAYFVLKLCENGVLDLDTPLTRYTTERYIIDDPRLDLITARHVLSHTSGFQEWRSGNAQLRIHFTPGESFMYSGEAYSYLQSVVTRLVGHVNDSDCATYEAGLKVCGTDVDAFIKKNLLMPLGMKSSGYLWNRHFEQHAALPHDSKGELIRKSRPGPSDAARYAAAGMLLTTPSDYSRFIVEVIAPGKTDAFHLSPRGVQEMIRPQIKVPDMPLPVSWGLGWRIMHARDGTIVCHDGGESGFRTFGGFSIEKRSGVVIMTNGDNGGTVINKLLFGDLLQPTGVALPELAPAR